MNRAAALSLCLAAPLWAALPGPVAAQTPVATSAANDLRVCLLDRQGFRDAARLAQLDLSLEQIRAKNWGAVTEIAPGVFHMLRNGTDRTVEIKLPDANGSAHCLAFGPSLGAGQGALVADKFFDLSFMAGQLAPAPVPQGYSRRYTVTGAPYQADLVAYPAATGDVVGFIFSGVPQGQKTRALSSADPSVTDRAIGTALSNAVEICLRNYVQSDTVAAALTAYGFEFGFATGGSQPKEVHFTPDNAVSILHGPGTCAIETNYMGPAATVGIVSTALNDKAPGRFSYSGASHNGCPAFYAGGSLNLPLGINISNNTAGQRGPATCIEDGTSRIHFEVAG